MDEAAAQPEGVLGSVSSDLGGDGRSELCTTDSAQQLGRRDTGADCAASAAVDQTLARRLLPEIYKVFNIKITRREPYRLGLYLAEKGGFRYND